MRSFLFLCTILLSLNNYAAFNAGTVWEFRDTATGGAMLNGCGFDSTVAPAGVDYTLQNGAQAGASDLATTNGTSNPCTVTASSHNFVTADNGNAIHIASGGTFTAGWYEIKSTAANAATLDRACASGASTNSGVWKEGGACILGSATLDTNFFASATTPIVAGNMVYFKNGSYTAGSALTAGVAGSTNAPIPMIGYNSSRTDLPTGSTRPTVAMGANNWALAANWDVYGMIITGTAAPVMTLGASAKFVNSKIINSSTTAARAALQGGGNAFILNSELVSYRGPAYSSSTANTLLYNYIHDSNIGFTSASTANQQVFIGNIFADNVTNGIIFTGASQSGNLTIIGNTFYGAENKLGVGVTVPSGTVHDRFINNIVYGFTTGVTNAETGQTISYDDYNNYFDNSTDNTNWTKGSHDIAANPGFGSIAQYTGATATTSGSVLTQSGATLPTLTPGADFVYLVSGTGITAGKYGIASNTSNTITLDIAPGTSAVADKVWQVTTGHNFSVGPAMKFKGFPGAFPAGLTTGYTDVGAAQRHEYGRPVR